MNVTEKQITDAWSDYMALAHKNILTEDERREMQKRHNKWIKLMVQAKKQGKKNG